MKLIKDVVVKIHNILRLRKSSLSTNLKLYDWVINIDTPDVIYQIISMYDTYGNNDICVCNIFIMSPDNKYNRVAGSTYGVNKNNLYKSKYSNKINNKIKNLIKEHFHRCGTIAIAQHPSGITKGSIKLIRHHSKIIFYNSLENFITALHRKKSIRNILLKPINFLLQGIRSFKINK